MTLHTTFHRTALLAALCGVLLLLAPRDAAAQNGFPSGGTWTYCYAATPEYPGFSNGIRCDASGSVSCTVNSVLLDCAFGGASPGASTQCWKDGLQIMYCDGFNNVLCGNPTYPAPYPQFGRPSGVLCYPFQPPAGLSVSPNLLSFPEQLLNSTSTARIVTLTNPGSGSIGFVGNPFSVSGPFAIANNGCAGQVLQSGNTACTLAITFTPTSAGVSTGLVNFTYGVNGVPASGSIGLEGDGVTAYSGPAVNFQPAAFTFPATLYGTMSGAYVMTLKNVGFSALSIGGVSTSSGEFIVNANTCGATLAPNGTCTIQVKFSPIATGTRNGFLQVASNAFGSPHQLPFSGVGTAPVYSSGPISGSNAGGSGGGRDHLGASVPTLWLDGEPLPKDCRPEHAFCDKIPVTGWRRPPCLASAGWSCLDEDAIDPYFTVNGIHHVRNAREPELKDSGDTSCSPTASLDQEQAETRVASNDHSYEQEIVDSNQKLVVALADHGRNITHTPSIYALDPIHTATGNKFHEQVDYIGQGALDLVTIRTYNSHPFASSSLMRQSFGPGWFSSWDRSVTLQSSGTIAQITRGDGKSYEFVRQSSGAWLPGAEVASALEEIKDQQGATTGWRYTTIGASVEEFDAGGRLLAITLRKGGSYLVGYSASGRIETISNSFNRVLRYEYDSAGRVLRLVDPAANAALFSYDSKGRLSTVSYPDGRSRTYKYEHATLAYAMTSILDETGQTYATFSHDSAGRADGNSFAGGVGAGSIAYSTSSTNSTTTAPNGTTWTRTFATIAGQVKMTSLTPTCTFCGSGAETFEYDSMGLLTGRVSRRGIRTNYSYNSRGLPVAVTEAVGLPEQRVTTTSWHPSLRLPLQIVRGSTTTSYQYDAAGRKTQETVASGGLSRTTSYAYNSMGQLTQVDGPRTDVADITSYTYDASGNLATMTNAKGHVTYYTAYDAHGRLLSVNHPDGGVGSFTYDARGRELTRTLRGRTTTYTYNQVGMLATETSPEGVVTTSLYDSAHRLYGIDRLGEKTRHTLNTSGQITKTEVFDASNVLVSTKSTVYDGLGRVKQTMGASGLINTYFYDLDGNVINVGDGFGYTDQTNYDGLNRPIAVYDRTQGWTYFTRNANDLLTSVKDPISNTTTYTVNGLGDTTQTASPDTGMSSVTFDSAGNALVRTDARGTTAVHTYDALGRATQVTYSDGAGINKTYDVGTNGVGRLSLMTDPSGSTSYTYDSQGWTTSKTQTVGGIGLTLGYGRDAIGRMTTITYPSGRVVGFSYADGRLGSMTLNGQPLVTGIQYFPFGGPESWLFGNGREYTRVIDQNGRIARYLTPNGERKLTFDAASRITKIEELVGGVVTRSQNFTYDKSSRVLTFTGFTSSQASESQTFTYDKNGNRLTAIVNGISQTYAYSAGSNRLASVTQGGQTILANTYDVAGNLTSDGTKTLSYDARGRMIQSLAGGVATTYLHNGYGLRVRKLDPSSTRNFLYDETGQLLGEYDQSGIWVREYVWLGQTPIAVLHAVPSGGGVGYIWTDQLNTPREITNQAAQSMWKWDSLPFGETLPNENPASLGPFPFNLRFPGQYFAQETGLHQNWNREYFPATARYTQGDALGLSAGTNLYVYANANPMIYSDSTGSVVEICARNFLARGWIPAQHDFVCVNGNCRGWYDNSRWLDDSRSRDSGQCYTVPDYLCGRGVSFNRAKFESCILERTTPEGDGSEYGSGLNNCQQQAQKVVRTCQALACGS